MSPSRRSFVHRVGLGRALARSTLGALLSTLGLAFLPLSAQTTTHWIVPTTIGFGGLGCGAGYLMGWQLAEAAAWESTTGPSVWFVTLGACVAGGMLGRKTGREADARLAAGEEVPHGLRRGVQLGTVLTGATVGTLASLFHPSRREVDRAEIVTAYALVGAAIGFAIQVALNPCLEPEQPPVSPLIGGGSDGTISFGLLARF